MFETTAQPTNHSPYEFRVSDATDSAGKLTRFVEMRAQRVPHWPLPGLYPYARHAYQQDAGGFLVHVGDKEGTTLLLPDIDAVVQWMRETYPY